jgi:hypothetical protein
VSLSVLVFGFRNLTARHLPAMRWHILAAVLYRFDESMGPIPLEWIDDSLPHRVPDDARFHEGPLLLIHGDGPPGKRFCAIGADKLSVVAASLEWPSGWKCRTHPPTPQAGETWAAAAMRRNSALVAERPDVALCFHTDPCLGRGSADTARKLTAAGIHFRVVLMDETGKVLEVVER